MSRKANVAVVQPLEITDTEFQRIARLVYDVTGIVLDETRRALVVGRLGKRVRARGLTRFKDYVRLVTEDDPQGEELRHLVNSITTNKTSFFRESHQFPHLRARIHERMQRARSQPSLRTLRIWSAGCSTGEEPYTIAMTVAEALGAERSDWDVRILATDIDTDVLAHASRGTYTRERIAGLPGHARNAFEEIVQEGRVDYRIRQDLRDMITFQQLNFMSPTWPMRGPFDFIFCRNVTIYFDRPTQERLYRKFVDLLARDGEFFAGHSENLTWLSDVLTLRGTAIYVHAGAPARTVAAAPAPAAAPASGEPPAKAAPWGKVPEKAIVAGEVVASKTPLLAKTTLGSCVAVCMYDPVAGIGGMNHFMLPGNASDTESSPRFGIHAMELLINQLLKLGANRARLVAKIAGACSVTRMTTGNVPEKNLAFIEEYLALEGFPVAARRVGGNRAMEVRFRTDTGEAFVRTVDVSSISRVLEQDASYRERVTTPAAPVDPDEGITWFK